MKRLFYPRLAFSGIRKNGKLYLPYVLSGIGMVMMYYILGALEYSPAFKLMKGGSSIGAILSLGKFVIAAFALLFLFYTNSFIVKKRYKEFGLFNVLGMNKGKICRVILSEALIVSFASLFFGILFGVLFSKLAELGLVNAVAKPVDYTFTLPLSAILNTLAVFGVIFLLLMFKSLLQVRKCKPLELLKSESLGEKPPKANFLLAVIGALLLAAAYYLAVSIKSPLSAINVFFVAVIMVIAATYMLFTAGSVAICKILQKRKSYYKKENFVAVSSMAYRMKRNGAGLASICILSTMVLVIISSTSSLYFGKNEALAARFPRENELSVNVGSIDYFTDENLLKLKNGYSAVFEKNGVSPQNITDYRYVSINGLLQGDTLDVKAEDFGLTVNYGDMRSVYIVSEEDYNRTLGKNLSLESGEAALYTLRCKYKGDSLNIGGSNFRITEKTDEYIEIGEANALIVPSLMMVVKDYGELTELSKLTDSFGGSLLSCNYYYGYDLDAPAETVTAIFEDVKDTLESQDFLTADGRGYSYAAGCLALEKDDFFVTFGGLFFLGIMLSVVFAFAAVMIIYYKQVSEGYEDKSRFDIMQKVGMTKEDIKKSINRQVVIVFFAPLLFAGLHLGFAFPLVWKMLRLFNLNNVRFVILVTVLAFLVFGIFYLIVYRLTARAYYGIVSEKE